MSGSPASGGASGRGANTAGAPTAGAGGAGAGTGGTGGAPFSGPGYFVSPDGSDDAPGTVDAPFQTLGNPPVVVSDNVWALAQYTTAVSSGVEDEYRSLIPAAVLAEADLVFPASYAAALDAGPVKVRRTRAAGSVIWFAPAGSTTFTEGATMTRAEGDAGTIALPANAGTYKLFVLDAEGTKIGESDAILRVN